MSALVISNFDHDSIKNEPASMETAFSNYKPMGNELARNFMHVLVTCKYKKNPIKNNPEKVEKLFSPLEVNGSLLLPWKPGF